MDTKTTNAGGLAGSPFSRGYWKLAAAELKSTRSLAFASMIIVLRVAVKAFRIPLAAGLSITFDSYINSLGSLIYGPLMGLCVGAVSDTLGCILYPSSEPYFFPFIFVEMLSSFIFGLFFWKRQISVLKVLTAKFSVNLVCNIILTSLFTKWSYIFYGSPNAKTYYVINLVRIVKNLVLFPAESVLIVMVLGAFIPPLKSMKMIPAAQGDVVFEKKHILIVIATAVLSVGLILFYIFYLRDYVSAHNVKLLV